MTADRAVVLVAPDSFKGTFTSSEAGEAIAAGLRAGGLDAVVVPIADGGEGTLDVLAGPVGATLRTAAVHDPLGREIDAAYALGPGIAVVEVARAAGLGLIAPDERDPWAASTAGVGELIAAAAAAGAAEILVGLGGSATTDGGAGAIAAISRAGGLGRAVRLLLLCDVTTPFEQAAAVFAPQKGADARMVERLTARLERQARELPRDPRGVPMTGAAGGMAGGLWAHLDARLVPGAAYILDRVGFERAALARARAVVTGEGRLDQQTVAGKAASAVVGRAAAAGVPVHAVVGENRLAPADWRRIGLTSVREAGTRAQLIAAGRELAAELLG